MGKAVVGFIAGALLVYLLLNAPNDTHTHGNLSEDPEYVANKAVVETMLQAYVDEDFEAWAATVSDTVKYGPSAYKYPASLFASGTKEDFSHSVRSGMDEFEDMSIAQAVYLPGLDGVTAEPDGSVRVYWQLEVTHTATGVTVDPRFYANFDIDGGQITTATFFGDAGGVANHIANTSTDVEKR